VLAIAGSDAVTKYELIAAAEIRINRQRKLIYGADAIGCTMICAAQPDGKLVPTEE